MAGQPSIHGSQDGLHMQMEPVSQIQTDPGAKHSSFASMHAEEDYEEGWREKQFGPGSQVVKIGSHGKIIPLIRDVVAGPIDDPKNDSSDDGDEFLYGHQTPSTDGSISPLLLTAGSRSLTHKPVDSKLSASDTVTIRDCSIAKADESIDAVLHEPFKPLPAGLGGLPRKPSQALIALEPDKRDAFLDWTAEKAEKSLLPTPLRIPDKAVTKGPRGPTSAPSKDTVIKGKKRERDSHEGQSAVEEKGLATLSEPKAVPVNSPQDSEGNKRLGPACESISPISAVFYQNRPLPQTPTPMSAFVRQTPNARTSIDSSAGSIASQKYSASVSSTVSLRDKPLPPDPPVALAPAFEMLRNRNSGVIVRKAGRRASPNEEQFRAVQAYLRSPRRSISPIQEGPQPEDLVHSPAPLTEPDDEDESHIHPLMRKDALAAKRYAEAKDLKPTPAMPELSQHRRQLSDGSSSEIVSPADMKSPFTRSSDTPSSYLHSPSSSPIPESTYESDGISELPLFRSVRASPVNLLMNWKRASMETRASAEMSGPESPYIQRNCRPERRRSREALKEYAEALEAINGLERLRDIDAENKDALVLGKHELINLGDIPNPNLSKISLSPVAHKSWPMKKKSSLLRKISNVDLQQESCATRESYSTMSSGSITQQSPGEIKSLSGSSEKTNTTDGLLPVCTPSNPVAPVTPRKATNSFELVFGSWGHKKERAIVMKDAPKRGHELEVLEAPKKNPGDVGNGQEVDKATGAHGHSFLKRSVQATLTLLMLSVLT